MYLLNKTAGPVVSMLPQETNTHACSMLSLSLGLRQHSNGLQQWAVSCKAKFARNSAHAVMLPATVLQSPDLDVHINTLASSEPRLRTPPLLGLVLLLLPLFSQLLWCSHWSASAVCASLQVPFLQAELHSSLPTRDPAARLQHVQAASEAYCAYLQRCQQYGLLRGPLAEAYSAEEAGSSVDPGTARNQRIERFKRSKAVSGLLQQMKGRRKRADEEVGFS
jgi:hypothetical protein